MRGTAGRAAAVWLAVLAGGCALPGDVHDYPPPAPADPALAPLPPFTPTPFAGDPSGDPEKTLAYWKKLKDILERTSGPAEEWCKRSVKDVRALPALGVDAELLEHAEAYARYCDRLVGLVEIVKENPALLRRHPHPERLALDAGRQALDVGSQLRGLRAKLSNRYGTEFPPIGGG